MPYPTWRAPSAVEEADPAVAEIHPKPVIRTASVAELENRPFVNSEGVNITIGEATNTGWSATAFHSGLAAETCALYHGQAAPVTPATVVSAVACTR